MNVIRKMSPHAAILIANMYYVFFGIDRVNTAMNFINNGYTKFLLVLLIAASAFTVLGLLAHHEQKKGDGREVQRLILPALHALLSLAVLVILIVDAILGDRGMPFLTEPVKFVTLVMCIAAWADGFRLIAADRAYIRAEQARRAAARRRQQQRRPAPQRQPAPRSRYETQRGSRYAADDRYSRNYAGTAARSRYSDGAGYSSSRSRYSDGDGYTSSRSRYSDSYGAARRSGYAGEDGIRRRSSSRYADDSYGSTRYSENRSRSGGYDSEVGGISRSSSSRSRYSDSDY